MKGAKLALPFATMLALLHASCGDATGPVNQANERIAIINDPAMLAGRVTYYDQDIAIDDTGVGYPSAPASAPSMVSQASRAFSLRLVAQVAPPTVGGQPLQATSIVINGPRAVVSYNMRGSQYLGGVDLYDFSSGVTLKSQALFDSADVSAVTTSGQNVFLAEQTNSPAFAAPAVLEKLRIVGTGLVLTGNRRTALSSYAATSVTTAGSRTYVTSGDNGKLYRVDTASLALLDSISLHDARWADVAGGKVVVAQGTPGQISVFNEADLAPLGTYPFTGADIAESKSTVQVVGGKAFVAAGRGGVQILSANTGTVVGSVPRPNPALLGLGDSVVVTNAVAVSDDVLFISNGEAGVYVARGSQSFATSGSETPQTINLLGRMRFGSLESVNHVAYVPPYLVIAAGLGGIKVVRVTF